MADQAMAESGSLAPLARRSTWPATHPLRRMGDAWSARQCWVRYLIHGRRAGIPGLADFTLGNKLFPANQVREELISLGEVLATQRPSLALEIGTWLGGTLFFLTRLASPRATIASVDLPGGRSGGYSTRRERLYKRFARQGQRLYLLRGDSHSEEMSARVKVAFGGRLLDYLFIDGDHRYEGVKLDFETYGPLVKLGGLIAFHDIAEGPPENVGGVPRFWREIKRKYRHEEFIRDPNQGGYGIGVLHVG